MACLGPAAAVHADGVAALLGDTGARTTRQRETVGEAALWALARMNDPRCLPGLVELIAGGPSGFASNSAHRPASDWHRPVLPAPYEALLCLPEHADVLMPAIRDRLHPATRQDLLRSLCEVLAHWGAAAEPAVPHLVNLLDDDATWVPAATALSGIGTAGFGTTGVSTAGGSTAGGSTAGVGTPGIGTGGGGAAGTRVLDTLAGRFGSGGNEAELAAWTYWRVGGDPEPALDLLGAAITADRFVHTALRRLADLGPRAACLTDRLRVLAASTDSWTGVEAAHALWATTGDTGTAVPVLTKAVQALPGGTYLPVMLPAVRHLTRIGVAARPAASLLADVDGLDQRLRNSGGRRGFTQDESIRTAIDELLVATAGITRNG